MDRSFFHFVRNHACDRRTDRILIARLRLHFMQRGKNADIQTDSPQRCPTKLNCHRVWNTNSHCKDYKLVRGHTGI